MTVRALAIIAGIIVLVALAADTWPYPAACVGFGMFGGWMCGAVWEWRKTFSSVSR